MDCNTVRKDLFLSTSWDYIIRVGNVPNLEEPSNTLISSSVFFQVVTVYVRDVI